jgi:hypothetical protein
MTRLTQSHSGFSRPLRRAVTFAVVLVAALVAAGLATIAVVILHAGLDATAASWVQGLGSILALGGTAWTVGRAAQLGREQMADAQRRDECSRQETRIRDTEAMICLVEVAIAAAIRASCFVERNLEQLRTRAGRRKIVKLTGIDCWLQELDRYSETINRIPFHDIGNAIAAMAPVNLLEYLAGFRSHAVIALTAEQQGRDRSDVFDDEHLGIELIQTEIDVLVQYRDSLKASVAFERAHVSKVTSALPA